MQYYLKAFQNFTNFEGRASRSEYWYFVLFNIIAAIAVILVGGMLKLAFLYPVYLLIALLPGIAVGIRRMHDVGKSGWFILIPFYNLILACTEGDKGDNKYGIDPNLNYFTE